MSAGSRSCNAMLTGSSFSNHTLLSHALGQQSLANRIVDLVRSSMRKVFALENDSSATGISSQSRCISQRCSAPNKVLQKIVNFSEKCWVTTSSDICDLKFTQRMSKSLWNITSTIESESIWQECGGIECDHDRIVGRLEGSIFIFVDFVAISPLCWERSE